MARNMQKQPPARLDMGKISWSQRAKPVLFCGWSSSCCMLARLGGILGVVCWASGEDYVHGREFHHRVPTNVTLGLGPQHGAVWRGPGHTHHPLVCGTWYYYYVGVQYYGHYSVCVADRGLWCPGGGCLALHRTLLDTTVVVHASAMSGRGDLSCCFGSSRWRIAAQYGRDLT